MIERNFPAAIENLDDVNDFLDLEFERNNVSLKTALQIKVAMEEIFVNIAHYAYEEKKGDVKVELNIDPEGITLRFSDSGTPFDPLAKPDPDITLSAEERPVGGLGIFMVKKTMDQVSYKYQDGKNVLTIFKKR